MDWARAHPDCPSLDTQAEGGAGGAGRQKHGPIVNEEGPFHPPCPIASKLRASQAHNMLRLEAR